MRLRETQHTYRTAIELGDTTQSWMVVTGANTELGNRVLSIIKVLKVHSLSAL